MDKNIFWHGFLKHAVKEYPKEACAFLFSKQPYSDKEEWHVFIIKNIAENPEHAWIPDKQEMLKVKAKATKLGLVKIGNVHTHPYWKEFGEFNIDKMDKIIQPSDKDLHFARKFNDVVRIIVCIDYKAVYGVFVHDKFGNKIDVHLIENEVTNNGIPPNSKESGILPTIL